ncbi:hypothetical protein D3C86_1615230 [compost metagenome]
MPSPDHFIGRNMKPYRTGIFHVCAMPTDFFSWSEVLTEHLQKEMFRLFHLLTVSWSGISASYSVVLCFLRFQIQIRWVLRPGLQMQPKWLTGKCILPEHPIWNQPIIRPGYRSSSGLMLMGMFSVKNMCSFPLMALLQIPITPDVLSTMLPETCYWKFIHRQESRIRIMGFL